MMTVGAAVCAGVSTFPSPRGCDTGGCGTTTVGYGAGIIIPGGAIDPGCCGGMTGDKGGLLGELRSGLLDSGLPREGSGVRIGPAVRIRDEFQPRADRKLGLGERE